MKTTKLGFVVILQVSGRGNQLLVVGIGFLIEAIEFNLSNTSFDYHNNFFFTCVVWGERSQRAMFHMHTVTMHHHHACLVASAINEVFWMDQSRFVFDSQLSREVKFVKAFRLLAVFSVYRRLGYPDVLLLILTLFIFLSCRLCLFGLE